MTPSTTRIWLTILVCGLGYFVDIYDLILFSIVRVESLTAIGVTATSMQDASEFIINAQMVGMLLGGLIFGMLADKKGRLSVMLGSILMYSVMNIANAFVVSVPMYALFRFLSGIGLAGELGVAVTLVAEIMPKQTRGYGTAVVASMGILGAVAAYVIHHAFDWKTAFVAGGLMGLGLLLLRVQVRESAMFHKTRDQGVQRGNVLMIFRDGRLRTYLSSVAVGVPIWYVIGILITFSPEFTREGGGTEPIEGGQGVMWAYVGLAAGDLGSGLVSQWLKSRRRTILFFLVLTMLSVAWYLSSTHRSATMTYIQCGMLGFSAGYWAVFVTTAAEQFGTNMRATVATTVPNVVRGALVPTLLLFKYLRVDAAGSASPLVNSAVIVGALVMAIALCGWYFLHESFGKDLDFVEP